MPRMAVRGLRQGLTVRLDAIEKDKPSRVKPGQKKSLGARQKRKNSRQNAVEVFETWNVWIAEEVEQVSLNGVGGTIAEIWWKRHVDEPSWKWNAIQDVNDESDGAFVPEGYERWTRPVCQGVLTAIWTNVTCVDVWNAVDDDSWMVCKVCPMTQGVVQDVRLIQGLGCL